MPVLQPKCIESTPVCLPLQSLRASCQELRTALADLRWRGELRRCGAYRGAGGDSQDLLGAAFGVMVALDGVAGRNTGTFTSFLRYAAPRPTYAGERGQSTRRLSARAARPASECGGCGFCAGGCPRISLPMPSHGLRAGTDSWSLRGAVIPGRSPRT